MLNQNDTFARIAIETVRLYDDLELAVEALWILSYYMDIKKQQSPDRISDAELIALLGAETIRKFGVYLSLDDHKNMKPLPKIFSKLSLYGKEVSTLYLNPIFVDSVSKVLKSDNSKSIIEINVAIYNWLCDSESTRTLFFDEDLIISLMMLIHQAANPEVVEGSIRALSLFANHGASDKRICELIRTYEVTKVIMNSLSIYNESVYIAAIDFLTDLVTFDSERELKVHEIISTHPNYALIQNIDKTHGDELLSMALNFLELVNESE